MSTLKPLTVLSCLCLAVCLLLAGCGPADNPSTLDAIVTRQELVVGVKTDAMPFGFKVNEQFAGYDVDLAEQIAHKLGVKIRFVSVTTADRIQKLKANEVDLIAASMSITREREKEVDFSLSYFATKQAFLVKTGSAVTGYMDLAKKKVGVVKGSTSLANLKVVQPDSEPVVFNSYTEAYAALKDGKIEALTSDLVLLVGLSQKDRDQFQVVGGFGYEPYGLALRENDSKFRDRINEILQELWDEGKLAQMIENWFGEHGRFPVEIDFTMETYPTGK